MLPGAPLTRMFEFSTTNAPGSRVGHSCGFRIAELPATFEPIPKMGSWSMVSVGTL